MTPTDEQIAEALAQADHGIMVAPLNVLASALRAAQERIKELEAKTVPMEMLTDLRYYANTVRIATVEGFASIIGSYGYTVTENAKEEGR